MRATFRRRDAAAPVLSLRQQIEGLRDRATPNGRTATVPLKRPGVDPLPAGLSLAGTSLTVGSYAGDLENWDFRGYTVTVRTQMGAIRQCLLGERAVAGLFFYLDVYVGGRVTVLENNDFTGPFTFGGAGAAINCRTSGTGMAVAVGRVPVIRANRFTGLSFDTIKAVGDPGATGQVIEGNYFGPPVNLPAIPTPFSMTTAYGLGDIVFTQSGPARYAFRSLAAGNLGNAAPTAKTSTAFWENLDPHADAITTVAAQKRLTIRRNLFDYTDDPVGPGGPFPSWGINNAIRISRNSGTDLELGEVAVEENVSYHSGSSFPIQVWAGVGTNFNGPIAFRDNWIGPNSGGSHFHPTCNDWVDAWSGNRSVLTDAIIAAPTLRARDVAAPTIAATSPADGATAPPAADPLVVTFSEAVALAAAGAIELRRQEQAGNEASWVTAQAWDLANAAHRGTGAGQVSVEGARLTVRPAAALVADKRHALLIGPGAVRDAAGNAFGGAAPVTAMSFATAAAKLATAAAPITFAFLGQSNLEYAMARSSPYDSTAIAKPTIANPNCTFAGANPATPGQVDVVPITDANVQGMHVNLAVATLAEFLGWFRPQGTFVLKDLAEAGTGRGWYQDDADDARTDGNRRIAAHTVAIANHDPDGTWGDVDLVVELWSANDRSSFPNFGREWSPLYLGQRWNGEPHVLGTANPDGSSPENVVRRRLWDVKAPVDQKGEGLWSRQTKWVPIIEPNNKADVDGYMAFHNDPRVKTFAEPTLGDWYGHKNHGHTDVQDPDGIVLLAWDVAPVLANHILLKEGQAPIGQPGDYRLVVTPGGVHADIFVKLPNGGSLSTRRREWNQPRHATPLAFEQQVQGIQVRRAGDAENQRQPVFRLDATAAPARFRGTVTLHNAGTGTGAAREGCIRVVPEVPFANGDRLYVRWDYNGLSPAVSWGADAWHGTDAAQKPFLDFPVETVPALTNPAALRPYPGLLTRCYEPPLVVSGVSTAPPPPTAWFTTNGTAFFAEPGSASTPRAVRYRGRFRVPVGTPVWSGNRMIAARHSDGFDWVMWRTALGEVGIGIEGNQVEDGNGGKVNVPGIGASGLADGEWHEFDAVVNLNAGTAQSAIDGVLRAVAFTPPASAWFQANRYGLLATPAGTQVMPTGIDWAYLEVHQTTGTNPEAPHKRIAGSAVAANADGWKAGTGAFA